MLLCSILTLKKNGVLPSLSSAMFDPGTFFSGNAAKPAKEKASESGSSKKMIHYTKDKLMELAAAPLSRKKPKCFVENQKLAR